MNEMEKYWIVVVDDETICLTNARNMLGEEGMRVSCLRSGSDLLKFMERNTPDLILLDVMMPVMNGFETYHALREFEDRESRPHIPVIFLTGENDSATEQQGLSLGASDYIHKPFHKDILVKRIENIIKNSKTIESLTEEAKVDMLTGFLNKAYGTERISMLCGRMTGALMILDLDNFKLVNDLFGHDMGDKVLVAVSDIIRKSFAETVVISRIGGDEFMAFCENLRNEGALSAMTLRLNDHLQKEAVRLMGEEHGIPLGISVGAVLVPEHGRNYEKLFACADQALYQVKQNGKHGYHLYDQLTDGSDTTGMEPVQKLERILRIVEERNDSVGAILLGSDSFVLVYQFIMRYYKRYGGTAALVLFTLSFDREEDSKKNMEIRSAFSNVLKNTLRKSDLIMQSGLNDYCVMLTKYTKVETEFVINRIVRKWNKEEYSAGVALAHVYRHIEHVRQMPGNA